MTELRISVEQNGKQVEIGQIIGNNIFDAAFSYTDDYLVSGQSIPISSPQPHKEVILKSD